MITDVIINFININRGYRADMPAYKSVYLLFYYYGLTAKYNWT